MAVIIVYKDSLSWLVSNARAENLLGFAIEVGQETARSAEELAYVDRLRSQSETILYASLFDLEREFRTVSETKFWARTFSNVARRIFLRKLGNQESDDWQDSAIGDAHILRRILAHAVRQMSPAEGAWWPEDEGMQTETIREVEALDKTQRAFRRLKG